MASPSGEVSQICTKTRQLLNGSTVHSRSSCLGTSMLKKVAERPFSVVAGRPVGLKEQRLPSSVDVRYLYQPGELEEVIAGQPTLRCLYRFTGLNTWSPIPASLCFIICWMGLLKALTAAATPIEYLIQQCGQL